MDASAITSAAPAVHQELVRKLAERGGLLLRRDGPSSAGGAGLSPAPPAEASGHRVTRSRRPPRHPPHYLPWGPAPCADRSVLTGLGRPSGRLRSSGIRLQ